MDIKSGCRLVLFSTFLSLFVLGDNKFGIKFRKICKDSIDILSSQAVKIEPYPKSHVKLALVDLTTNSEVQISFDFRTTSPDGVLFYGRSQWPTELIALILRDGDLIYKIRCSSLYADTLIPTKDNKGVNDSEWHTVTYSIKDSKGYIEIDGFSSANLKRYIVSCNPLTTFIMGGLSEDDKEHISALENLPGHFEGCMRNVFLPGPLRYPPKYYAVSVCE